MKRRKRRYRVQDLLALLVEVGQALASPAEDR